MKGMKGSLTLGFTVVDVRTYTSKSGIEGVEDEVETVYVAEMPIGDAKPIKTELRISKLVGPLAPVEVVTELRRAFEFELSELVKDEQAHRAKR